MARVLVIVVTYNALPWIDRCLGSLEESSEKVDVMVIDNGSLDGTDEYVQDHFPRVEFVDSEENLGFGAANNIGFRYALEHDYEFVYLLNQDAWVEKDTIATLIACAGTGYGILSPMQMEGKGRKMDRRFEARCGRFIRQSSMKVVTVPFVMAAHWLIRRDALEMVGGFSPAFKHYGEDDNWIDRLHHFRMSVGVVPSAKAIHDRAQRRSSHEQKMKLKCVGPVVRISDPGRNFWLRCALEPLVMVGMSLKNFSLYPLKQIPVLVRRYPELRRLRLQSEKKKAFL